MEQKKRNPKLKTEMDKPFQLPDQVRKAYDEYGRVKRIYDEYQKMKKTNGQESIDYNQYRRDGGKPQGSRCKKLLNLACKELILEREEIQKVACPFWIPQKI